MLFLIKIMEKVFIRFKYKVASIFLILLVIITINSVCASEVGNDTISSADSPSQEIVATNEKMILGDNGDVNAFQDKYDAGNIIELENNYTFSEEFVIDKDVTINGNGFSIKASGENRIFTINEARVILNNITFLNGNPLDVGGSIWINPSSDVEINNCVFKNNSALDGGAIYCGGSNCTITNSKFYDNVQDNPSTNDGGGGAIYLIDSNANIQNCEFINNSASIYAAAIYFTEDSETVSLSVNNSIFRKNNATNSINEGNYGAIYVAGANFLIYNSKFENNYADYGGAIGFTDCYGVIHNSTFSDNEAFYYAGAINAEAMELLISNSSFINNKIIGPYDEEAYFIEETQAGGAIVWHTNKGSIVNSKFINNQAKSGSSIIITYDCICEINGSTFSDEANSYAIYNLNSELQLNNNVLDKNNFIYNSYLISSKTFIVVLNNNTFNLNPNSKMALTARVTDDNNNTIILGYNFETPVGVLKFLINEKEIDAEDNNGVWTSNDEYEFVHSCIVSAKILSDGTDPLSDLEVKFAKINIGANVSMNVTVDEDIDFNQNSTVLIKINEDARGNITIYIDGNKTHNIVLSDTVKGIITYNVSELSGGLHKIKVEYSGDETYLPSNYNTTINVNKINSTISVSSTNIKVGDIESLVISLSNGTTGSVEIWINDVLNGTIYNLSSLFTYDLVGLTNGTYEVLVVYSGDDNYNENANFTSFNVTKLQSGSIIMSDSTYAYNSTIPITATFYDENGEPLKNANVTFIINKKNYTVTTDSNGTARLNEILNVGNYNITAINSVTGENLTKTLTISPRLIENVDLVKDYLDANHFKIRALGDDGNPVGAGEIVKITVNGITYECITDVNGYATLPIRLIPGNYRISAEYCGFNTYNDVIVKQILKAKKVKVKKSAKRFKIKASLKTTNGKPIVGKTIVFKFKGKKYKATTNSKGKASIVIKKKVINKLKSGKKYNVKIRYVDDRIKTFVVVKK